MRIVVVGGGVIGLLTARVLAPDHEVVLVADELGPQTTSARAGASFKPSGVDRSPLVRELLDRSAAVLRSWDRDGTSRRLAISRSSHVEASSATLDDSEHLDLVDDLELLSAASGDAVPGGYAHARRYVTWFFDVPLTLPRLVEEVRPQLGALHRARIEEIGQLPQLVGPTDLVVNAAGLGARDLADDDAVLPVRGQTLLVERPDRPVEMTSADGFYVYPRSDGMLVGGTSEEGSWDETPDPAVAQLLLRGNARIVPELLTAVPLRADAGLRPFRRGGPRVERDDTGEVPVVHAYGHGGSGWTLGPGTAAMVRELVDGR